MRRFLIAIVCCMLLVTAAQGVGISSCTSETVVTSKGSCQVTVTMTLQVESPVSALVFPLPAQARSITVNGSSVRSSHTGTVRNVDLASHVAGAGTYSLVLRYSINDIITQDEKDNLTLTLPLLCGFAYPVEALSFTVTLPTEVSARPSFTSTYYQEAAESVMTVQRQGSVISGTVNQRLQDHESLTMLLPVTAAEFPQSVAKRWSLDTIDLIMLGIAALAIAYWALTMGWKKPGKIRCAQPPGGITAGELGCRLTGSGADLTMMVVSWAEMGYLLIHPDDNGRVLLHKRMDMGNERSDFENRYFRNLFGRRKTVDATGYHYAHLAIKASRSVPGAKATFRKHTGNPRIFRILCAAIGVFAGVSLGNAFVEDTGWRIVLGIVLGILIGAISWLLQSGAQTLHRRDKFMRFPALGGGIVFFLLSLWAGEWNVALFVIPAQLLAGLAAAYGGRRTPEGQQDMAEILGLRRYLTHMNPQQLHTILEMNPDYYHTMAPYALALGADRAFARQLGNTKLPQCTYLTTGMDGHMTAKEWNQLLRDTVETMDALRKRLPLDMLLGRN